MAAKFYEVTKSEAWTHRLEVGFDANALMSGLLGHAADNGTAKSLPI